MIVSKFIRKEDLFDAPMILTIRAVSLEEVMDGESKYVLWFNEVEKGITLGARKIRLLELYYGTETDYWRGQRVKLSHDPTVEFGGKMVGGVKITCSGKPLAPGAKLPAAPPHRPMPPGGVPPPPQPVLNPTTGLWELPPQPRAPVAGALTGAPPPPPQPVYDPILQQWVLPGPAASTAWHENDTAEQAAAKAAARAAQAPATDFSDQTSPHPQAGTPGAEADFDDDIPF